MWKRCKFHCVDFARKIKKKLTLDPEMKTSMQTGGWLALCSDGENGLLPRHGVTLSVNDGSHRAVITRSLPLLGSVVCFVWERNIF